MYVTCMIVANLYEDSPVIYQFLILQSSQVKSTPSEYLIVCSTVIFFIHYTQYIYDLDVCIHDGELNQA